MAVGFKVGRNIDIELLDDGLELKYQPKYQTFWGPKLTMTRFQVMSLLYVLSLGERRTAWV
jgi:hypothetical protein